VRRWPVPLACAALACAYLVGGGVALASLTSTSFTDGLFQAFQLFTTMAIGDGHRHGPGTWHAPDAGLLVLFTVVYVLAG